MLANRIAAVLREERSDTYSGIRQTMAVYKTPRWQNLLGQGCPCRSRRSDAEGGISRNEEA